MKQYKNKKSSSRRDFISLHVTFLAISLNFFFVSEALKNNWWGIGLIIFLVVIYFTSLIKLFANIKQEVVLEFNEEEMFFHDFNTKVLWKEIKKVELVYKTFSSIIRVTTSKKIEFTKKRNLLKRFFSMLRMPKMEHVITIYVDKMEGDYLEIFEDIETTFYKNR